MSQQNDANLARVPEWKARNGALTRTFKLDSFAFAIEFVRRIGDLAEIMGTEPDINIRGSNVKLTLESEDDAVSTTTVRLAQQIDRLLDQQIV